MKNYVVATNYGFVDIRAERIERQAHNDKATKILFLTGDDIVAEFYCDHICGWFEKKENMN